METDTRAHGGGATVADPVTGHLLDGRYRIGRRIARGGMASVYEALDTRLDRTCAIKIMHHGLGDDVAFADRFKREARAAARLNHPNVVNVFDQGDDPEIDGGTLYLVMELVPGHTLRDVIRDDAPMPAAKALAIMEPVVSALAAAHRSGLIHRDIKPENVLIADEESSGRVKVADFGLAKAVSADTQHTATGGVIIGTVSYLAPELVVDGTSDARADVYAAGVVLYELLTGEKPHAGESPIAIAYKHVHEDVPPPSRLAPGVPPYVDALVARATARDRAQRPADAGVLLHQLHRVSQALAGGVRDDEELTADLALPAPKAEPSEPVTDDTNAFEILPIAEPFEAAGPAAPPVFEPQSLAVPPSEPPVRVLTHPAGPRRSRRGPVLLAVALAIAVAAGLGAYWFGWARYTATPGVIGLTQHAATVKLDHAGLDVKIGDPSYSEDVPEGRVVGTDPAPGARVLDHGTVTLSISLGKERYAVPKVARMTVDQAQDALLRQHLTYGRSFLRYDDSAPQGMVLGSNPAAGHREPRGFQVDLVVSRGPRPIHVRDWSGRSADRAVRVMRAQGLQVDTGDQQFSDSVPRGHVIAQDPVAGRVVHRGDTVSLTVSKGPELVQIPGNLRAMGVDAATALLEGLGFQVKVERSDIYLGLGYVADSDPSPGSMARKGSTVVLKIV
ncbi:MAG TPA: Stk1 family PASTA domain-containing Ser/Thr kinase [Nocardioides sp.]|nr:Stk1 family PASTA domain-containing Ser/Thr kinase [Nocardioides sp.]HEX3297930.1 Stk1 family PASTA domain-containing Ser/Thr kinase [Nocardioides sp.]